ncbi:MAG: RNA polymerase sigma factor [Crocinitomicaceae bacterium]
MSMNSLEDHELIKKYIAGNEKAFEVLLLRHKDRIFRFIQIKVRDGELAADIFQEAFIKIVNTLKAGSYSEEGKFLPWALRICHNLVIDHFRKNGKYRMISESSSLKEDYNIFHTIKLEEENVQDIMTREEIEGQLVDLIEYLPDNQKDILKMRIYKEMSFKDIAKKEEISINTALGRMRYALMNLRKLIDKYEIILHS